MTECLICLDYLQDKDPKGKAWLSCNCTPQYHATCLNDWLYADVYIGKNRIVKSCPICKDLTLYIDDFIPPFTPPPSPKPKVIEKKQTKFQKILKRISSYYFKTRVVCNSISGVLN